LAQQEVDSDDATLHSGAMSTGRPETMSFEELEKLALNLENQRRLDEARDAFDEALQLNPASQSACEGRARLAIQLREDGAAERCARALAFRDNDPDLQVEMIAAAASGLGVAAIPLLENYLSRHPEKILAQELMANLRAQAGAGDAFADAYVEVLSRQPENKPLLMSYWSTLSRSRRYLEALDAMDAQRALFGGDRDFAMLEIGIASHSGQIDRARALLDVQDDRPDAQLARGLNALQTARPDEAAKLLEGVVDLQPDNFEAWSLLELAWRIIGDPRHPWLIGQPPLYGASQLDLMDDQLVDIAAMLRTVHRASEQPIGQSLRGGTQTPGQLFEWPNPEMKLLTDALAAVIRKTFADLPPTDARHPLLRHRDMGIAFGPSWSVRFTGSGHHAAHFHPGGIFSSACYIVVPEIVANSDDQAGWFELGRPPAELGLDVPPITTFEPKPGRLVLFPSFLFHGTRPFSGGERLSVAFDLVPVPMS
jgi:Tfp pilus assembly protein PilF